jgi:hypothetical protein
MIEFQSANPIRDLEDRLAPRRAAEARHHKGPTAHGHTDLLLRADRVLGPLLKLALRGTGLYRRGLRNALQLRVRHLRFVFPNLPPWLHGFRILHLSDLHIDGVPGLTRALCDCVCEIPVDLCAPQTFRGPRPSSRQHSKYNRTGTQKASRIGFTTFTRA